MKKLVIIIIAVIVVFCAIIILQGINKKNEVEDIPKSAEKLDTNTQEKQITKEMAYEGVNNYCHSNYDWSIAGENPSIMYLEMGEETENEYKITFRSYTGTFVYFYVDKLSGTTRLVEYVPTLNIEEDAGSINLYDYLNKNN